MESARDEFGYKFFIERKTDHKMIVLGIAGSKNEALELRLARGLENEMKCRHPETDQDPDDKTGIA